MALGNLPAALTSDQASLRHHRAGRRSQMAARLLAARLAAAYERIGDVQMAQGNLPAALTSFRRASRSRSAWQSPTRHADWERDLSVSDYKLGNVQMAQGI